MAKQKKNEYTPKHLPREKTGRPPKHLREDCKRTGKDFWAFVIVLLILLLVGVLYEYSVTLLPAVCFSLIFCIFRLIKKRSFLRVASLVISLLTMFVWAVFSALSFYSYLCLLM